MLLKKIGLRDYIPRADDVLRLQKRIFDEAFHGATLAGCEIVSFRQKLWIVPELKNEVKLSKKDWEIYQDDIQDPEEDYFNVNKQINIKSTKYRYNKENPYYRDCTITFDII